MNQHIKVSIVVPVYNVERYLEKCLGSIINQSHQNIEVLLVDDGATDKSGEICDYYAQIDKRIYVVHQKNKGVSSARNAGIEKATGDYVCFADADDFMQPDYVEYLLQMAVEYDVDIALTKRMFTTFSGLHFPTDYSDVPLVISGKQAAIDILYYHIPIGCYCKIFKRQFLLQNGIRFLNHVFVGEGFNFNVSAFLKADKVAVGSRRVYCYRRDNPASCMTSFKVEKSNMALEAIKIIRKTLPVDSKDLNEACNFADWHTHGDMYNWMVLAKVKKEYPQSYHTCYKVIRNYSCKALFAQINKKERMRAIIQFISPRLFAFCLELRRFKAELSLKNSKL